MSFHPQPEQTPLWEFGSIQPDIPIQIFSLDDIFKGHTGAINELAAALKGENDVATTKLSDTSPVHCPNVLSLIRSVTPSRK